MAWGKLVIDNGNEFEIDAYRARGETGEVLSSVSHKLVLVPVSRIKYIMENPSFFHSGEVSFPRES